MLADLATLARAVLVVGCFASVAGCRRSAALAAVDGGIDDASGAASAAASPAMPAPSSVASLSPAANSPLLAAIGMQANIYSRPDGTSKRVGYLRLGGSVARDPKPAGTAGCPGGWYRVYPRGYVCTGTDATTDPENPIARAAAVRPDITKAMPYRYAFVRAVAPLYLRIPTAQEQTSTEFKLAEHLDWWKVGGARANKVIVGANDVPIDARGAPLARAADAGPLSALSTDLPPAVLLGAQTENDPVPFWLEGGRKIPNVSDFKVPAYAHFANRVRRHTGLALIGSFSTGADSLNRGFAITTDLRLVPTSKLKPDTGSPFHGVELTSEFTLPIAFVRSECDKDKPCAHTYRLTGEGAHQDERTMPFRQVVRLSGKTKRAGISLYRETVDGAWLKASDLGVATAPSDWPSSAQAGAKWIDISIENQVMVLWEGQKPVYATLVSTGQDGLGDPKTTKSTVTGNFRIKSKHVTATMDSNESSGAAAGGTGTGTELKEGSDPPAPPKMTEGDTKGKVAPSASTDPPGRQVRRGEGTFELRDVPYVEYFEAGYALHAAYWHDVFGKARSHGCVNLSPVDAHRVFLWSDPPVPDGWHGVISGQDAGEGTMVSVHK